MFLFRFCLYATALATVVAPVNALALDVSIPHSRRDSFGVLSGGLVASFVGGFGGNALGAELQEPGLFDSYQVSTSNGADISRSSLKSITVRTRESSRRAALILTIYCMHAQSETLFSSLTSIPSGALWLGEHHNAQPDHTLQANLLRELHQRRRGLALGLEQIQVQFQPVLDQFIAGDISLAAMRQQTDYDRRWVWPFELYEPLFRTARELQVPLVALNVDSEDLALVEKGGLPGLPRNRLERYIGDT